MLNVRFYHPENDLSRTNIQIPNSLSITAPLEQEAILKVITESSYYSYEEFGSIQYMQAQWVAHNTAHAVATSGWLGRSIVSFISGSSEPEVSSNILDIRSRNNIPWKSKIIYGILELLC